MWWDYPGSSISLPSAMILQTQTKKKQKAASWHWWKVFRSTHRWVWWGAPASCLSVSLRIFLGLGQIAVFFGIWICHGTGGRSVTHRFEVAFYRLNKSWHIFWIIFPLFCFPILLVSSQSPSLLLIKTCWNHHNILFCFQVIFHKHDNILEIRK